MAPPVLQIRRERKELMEKFIREEMKIKIIHKKDSHLMKIYKILGKKAWNGVSYNLGKLIYPAAYYEDIDTTEDIHKLDSYIAMLAHESKHAADMKLFTYPLYIFLYLCPQILVLLSLMSLNAIDGSMHWLWSLSGLALAAPLPSPRAYLEARAYVTGMAVRFRLTGRVPPYDRLADIFCKIGIYYKMFAFKKYMIAYFERKFMDVRAKRLKDNHYVKIKKYMKI